MKIKNFTHFICLHGIAMVLLLGVAITLPAQTGNSRLSPAVNQDSAAFHSSLSGGGGSMINNISGMQTMSTTSAAPYSGSFTVGGNESSYYPVRFDDSGWGNNEATILELGRSSTHINGNYAGALIATFRFHTTLWGNAAHFIDADIKQYDQGLIVRPFIAGWKDVTNGCSSKYIVIWLKGNSTYYYHSNYSQDLFFSNSSITVCNNTYPVKTQLDSYVNSYGPTYTNNIWVAGNKPNYFAGNVGIGTTTPAYMLTVAGVINAREVKVDATAGGADFVFADDYRLRSLPEVEQFITANKHLPDIAPADSMVQNGVNMGEMQIQLLQKIEELTLYVIEQQRQIEALRKEVEEVKNIKK